VNPDGKSFPARFIQHLISAFALRISAFPQESTVGIGEVDLRLSTSQVVRSGQKFPTEDRPVGTPQPPLSPSFERKSARLVMVTLLAIAADPIQNANCCV